MKDSVNIPLDLANTILDELYELRGERLWWKDEPWCNYQRDYRQLCDKINALERILGLPPSPDPGFIVQNMEAKK